MPAAKKADAPMSAFERKRLENIAANKAILSDIAVHAKKVAPEPLPRTRAPRPASSAKKRKSEPVTRIQPTRTRASSRLAGLDADNETLKRKYEVAAEEEAEKAKAKRMRNADDLQLGDIGVDGRKFDNTVDSFRGIFRGADPGFRTFTVEDVKETTDAGLKKLREKMSALEIYEHWAPNGKARHRLARRILLPSIAS